jgi:hypothetical protein
MTDNKNNPLTKLYFMGAFLLLLSAAFGKFYSAFSDPHELPMLRMLDPIFLVENWAVMIGTGLVEVSGLIILVASRRSWFKATFLVWLSLNFILYRLAYFSSGAGRPCPCLGNLAAKIGLSSADSEFFLRVSIVYLLAGGLIVLFKLCSSKNSVGGNKAGPKILVNHLGERRSSEIHIFKQLP